MAASGMQELAVLLQSRVSEVLHVDIHPAAKIGRGILMDHATGIVIGETAVVGDNVSLLHQVTLGGSGTGKGVRHPHVGGASGYHDEDCCSPGSKRARHRKFVSMAAQKRSPYRKHTVTLHHATTRRTGLEGPGCFGRDHHLCQLSWVTTVVWLTSSVLSRAWGASGCWCVRAGSHRDWAGQQGGRGQRGGD